MFQSENCIIIILLCVSIRKLYHKEISVLFFLFLNFSVTFSSPSIMKFLVFAFILILTPLYFSFSMQVGIVKNLSWSRSILWPTKMFRWRDLIIQVRASDCFSTRIGVSASSPGRFRFFMSGRAQTILFGYAT